MVHSVSVSAGLLSLWAGLVNAQGHYADNQAAVVQDNEAAAANFPDVEGVELLSPAFTDPESVPAGFWNGTSGPTSQATMDYYLQSLAARNSWMTYRTPEFLSEEGRSLPYVMLSSDSQPRITANASEPKLRIWLNGGVHGNEPAGDQALLALLGKMDANSTWAESLLEVADVMVIPRYNPDGVAYFQRQFASGFDPNRDLVKQTRQQTRDLKKLITSFNPHVGIDSHEYSANRRYGDELQYVSPADGEFSPMKNMNIHPDIRAMTEGLFTAAVAASFKKHDLRWSAYVVGLGAENGQQVFEELTGEPRYTDTSVGLMQSAVFLTETRGIMLGGQQFQRRVASGLLMIEAVLQTCIDHFETVYNTIEDSRKEFIESDDDIIITEVPTPSNISWSFLQPDDGEIVSVPVTFLNTTNAKANVTRSRPEGYIFPGCWPEVADRLRTVGVKVDTLTTPFKGEVEAFNITSSTLAASIWEGQILNTVEAETMTKEMEFPAGSFWVSTRQKDAALAWLMLEPEALDSFARYNIMPVSVGWEYPVYRVMA